MYELQYPIGEFSLPQNSNETDIKNAISDLEFFPLWIERAIENLDAEQLATPYRPGGWTVAQVVHHCADSHINMFIRLKLAMTELNPTIKPYREDLWAEQVDYNLPINNSTTLLHCIHKKIVSLFNSFTEEDWQKTYIHPQYMKQYTLKEVLFLYSWHCKHHFEHINKLKNRMGW